MNDRHAGQAQSEWQTHAEGSIHISPGGRKVLSITSGWRPYRRPGLWRRNDQALQCPQLREPLHFYTPMPALTSNLNESKRATRWGVPSFERSDGNVTDKNATATTDSSGVANEPGDRRGATRIWAGLQPLRAKRACTVYLAIYRKAIR